MIKKKKKLVAEEMPEFDAGIEAMSLDSKIFVDKSLEIATYIFRLMEAKGINQRELAERMGKSEAEVSKILSGMHNLTLRSLAKLEAALEETIVCTPKHGAFSMPKIMDEMKKLSGIKSKSQKIEHPSVSYEGEMKVMQMQQTHFKDQEASA